MTYEAPSELSRGAFVEKYQKFETRHKKLELFSSE